jgi:Rieske Fe-S protein
MLAASVIIINGCSKGADPNVSSPVPNESVNVSFNVNTQGYTSLQTTGGATYLANVGYRGILVYRLNTTTIVAFDRTCTYDISDVNGIVTAQNNVTAICLDCGSTYSLINGSVNTGPTTIGLKEYTVNFTQATGAVTITN